MKAHHRFDSRRFLPGEATLEGLSTEEIAAARGAIVYRRTTSSIRRWLRILGSTGLPERDARVVTVLSGRQNRELAGLGMCVPRGANGTRLGVILLDDPDPACVDALAKTFKSYMPKTYTKKFFHRSFDALLLQTYLHELGHALYILSNGNGGKNVEHEEAAESYAWRVMERILPREIITGALGLMWLIRD